MGQTDVTSGVVMQLQKQEAQLLLGKADRTAYVRTPKPSLRFPVKERKRFVIGDTVPCALR